MPFDYSICEFVLYYLCLKAVLDSNCNVNQNELSWYLVETPGNRFPNSKNRKLKSPNAGISSNWEKDGRAELKSKGTGHFQHLKIFVQFRVLGFLGVSNVLFLENGILMMTDHPVLFRIRNSF